MGHPNCSSLKFQAAASVLLTIFRDHWTRIDFRNFNISFLDWREWTGKVVRKVAKKKKNQITEKVLFQERVNISSVKSAGP